MTVPAYGIEIASESCPFENYSYNYHYCYGCDHPGFYLGRDKITALSIVADTRQCDPGMLELEKCLLRCCAGSYTYYGYHTPCQEHACQGDNKWLYFKISDQYSMNKPEGKTYTQCDKHRTQYSAAMILKINDTDHSYKSSYTSAGDIDTSRNHNHGQSACYYKQICIVVEKIKKLLWVQKTALPDEHRNQVHAKEGTNRYRHKQSGIG